MGHLIFSLIGLKRIMFRNIFQRALRAILVRYKLGDRVLLPFNDLLEYSVHRDDGKDSEFGPPLKADRV